jgi:hypothetical protein
MICLSRNSIPITTNSCHYQGLTPPILSLVNTYVEQWSPSLAALFAATESADRNFSGFFDCSHVLHSLLPQAGFFEPGSAKSITLVIALGSGHQAGGVQQLRATARLVEICGHERPGGHHQGKPHQRRSYIRGPLAWLMAPHGISKVGCSY